MFQTIRQNWFSNVRGDLLAGSAVALTVLPEAIAISAFKRHLSASIVMVTAFVVVVATHDLAHGVLAGVLFAALFVASKVGDYLAITSDLIDDLASRHGRAASPVVFAPSDTSSCAFDLREAIDRVVVDLSVDRFGSHDKSRCARRPDGSSSD